VTAKRSKSQMALVEKIEQALGVRLCYYCFKEGHRRSDCLAHKPAGQIPQDLMDKYEAAKGGKPPSA
jgi:hypothetical protein